MLRILRLDKQIYDITCYVDKNNARSKSIFNLKNDIFFNKLQTGYLRVNGFVIRARSVRFIKLFTQISTY